MFGFGRLGAYDYFSHIERELDGHFRDAGHTLQSYVVEVPPTASIRRRAAKLASLVAETAPDDGSCIHLVGHSTGGLDARLVASPTAHLPGAEDKASRWLDRLASVTTLNTPHYGTPLASFFTTVSGQRMLYALSALTYIGLSMGAPPLAAASALVVALGRIDRTIGVELRMLDRATESLLKVLEPARSSEVRTFLDAIKQDQGAMVQLMPEAMDLFQAGIENRAGVRYQSTVSMAPPPSAMRYVRSLSSAWSAASATLFAAIWRITARVDERYPCAAKLDAAAQAAFTRGFGQLPDLRASDGVVPVHSQVWGDVVWAGYADHLDVLGHFKDDGSGTEHRDWLASGAEFTRAKFDQMTDAIVAGMFST